ncbi:RrF2 family transcriptional regulator [Pararhodobacter zhoushanensis]|uniref:Rrf2 family transcriptional regulator n=1 Tax=Pararhodobacter zhoushanensis TaxID=2479545 RepID=A0ABT3GZN9_9RHOB|nr:Rrf2 family transcriptional regulator [Pararhodobacter zhoushanensis]MCW1933026.1 Rrf2 family transcriptional regulator [Pararhodobacter zhoushanensis]
MRLTLRTNLAMRTLMHCATQFPVSLRTADVASACNASFHHVAQVVNQLESGGFLATSRGRGGGIALAKPAAEIGVGTVIRLFEADLPFAECMDDKRNTCPLVTVCRLKGLLCEALDAFYSSLDRYTVHDLIDGNAALVDVLTRGGNAQDVRRTA